MTINKELLPGITINGRLLHYMEIKDYLLDMITCGIGPHIKFAPLDVMKDNVTKIYELFEEFIVMYRVQFAGKERGRMTRILTSFTRTKAIWLNCMDRNQFEKHYYDLVMGLSGLGPLRGFGIMEGGRLLVGDPERISVDSAQERKY